MVFSQQEPFEDSLNNRLGKQQIWILFKANHGTGHKTLVTRGPEFFPQLKLLQHQLVPPQPMEEVNLERKRMEQTRASDGPSPKARTSDEASPSKRLLHAPFFAGNVNNVTVGDENLPDQDEYWPDEFSFSDDEQEDNFGVSEFWTGEGAAGDKPPCFSDQEMEDIDRGGAETVGHESPETCGGEGDCRAS